MVHNAILKIAGRAPDHRALGNESVDDLKSKVVRGGTVVITAQGLKFAIQTGSIVVLARLLSPADFGIQAMVVAMTGFLGLFRDVGLSMATVQRDIITHEQASTLFWINTAVGVLLSLLCCALAPVLVTFYKEPRLLGIAMVSGTAFIFNGVAAQHQALLVRRLRFAVMAATDVFSIGISAGVGIVLAWMGFGYWALVVMAVCGPAALALALWVAVLWFPGLPKRRSGIRSMLHLGGAATGVTVISYFGSNAEKLLLGRFWGASALGLYGRAYQLVNLPLQQLSTSIFNIVFPALSRVQNDSERVRRYFMKSYSLTVSACVPIMLSSALFASDLVPIVLGPKWKDAIPILRILAPTIGAFALTNPFGWFLLATGRAVRSLQMTFLVTPVMIAGIVLGIPHGPIGVAVGYSTAATLMILPAIAWAKKGTAIKTLDVWMAVKGPILSGIIALTVGVVFVLICGRALPQVPRLLLGLTAVLGTYFTILLFGMGQWGFYSNLIAQFLKRR